MSTEGNKEFVTDAKDEIMEISVDAQAHVAGGAAHPNTTGDESGYFLKIGSLQ